MLVIVGTEVGILVTVSAGSGKTAPEASALLGSLGDQVAQVAGNEAMTVLEGEVGKTVGFEVEAGRLESEQGVAAVTTRVREGPRIELLSMWSLVTAFTDIPATTGEPQRPAGCGAQVGTHLAMTSLTLELMVGSLEGEEGCVVQCKIKALASLAETQVQRRVTAAAILRAILSEIRSEL